jgi:hypothetical protein
LLRFHAEAFLILRQQDAKSNHSHRFVDFLTGRLD